MIEKQMFRESVASLRIYIVVLKSMLMGLSIEVKEKVFICFDERTYLRFYSPLCIQYLQSGGHYIKLQEIINLLWKSRLRSNQCVTTTKTCFWHKNFLYQRLKESYGSRLSRELGIFLHSRNTPRRKNLIKSKALNTKVL